MSSRKEVRYDFVGVDNGVSTVFDRLNRVARESAFNLFQESQKVSGSYKEQIRYIQEQITERKKLASISLQEQTFSVNERYDKKLDGAKTDRDRKRILSDKAEELESLKREGQEERLIINKLEELIETVKRAGREELTQDRTNTEQLVRENRNADRIRGRIGQGNEDSFKRRYQESLLGGGDPSRESSSLGSGGWGGKLSGRALASSSPYSALTSLAPAVLGATLGAILAKSIADGQKLEESGKGYFAVTRSTNDVGYRAGKMGSRGMPLGYSKAESYDFATNLSRASGRIVSEDETFGLLGATRAYGLSQEQVIQTQRGRRRTDVGAFQSIESLKSILPEGTGNTRLEELLQVQNQLISQQTSTLEYIPVSNSLSVMSMMSKVGGSFADPASMGQRIGTLNQSITSPGNDYKQAMVYSALRKIKPGASLFELQEMQEKGIYQPGLMDNLMSMLTSGGFSQDNQLMMLKEFTGYSASQTRGLFGAYKKNPNLFKGITEKGGYGGLSPEDLESEASQYFTGNIRKATAATTDAFAVPGEALINFTAEAVQKLDQVFNKYLGPSSSFQASSALHPSVLLLNQILLQLKYGSRTNNMKKPPFG